MTKDNATNHNHVINHLKEQEGLKLRPYKCTAGHWTIGYGHKIRADGGVSVDTVIEAFKKTGIDNHQAQYLLIKDIEEVSKQLDKVVKVPLATYQKDALVCLVFNWGIGNFKKSTCKLLKFLNNKEYDKAANEFLDIVLVDGKVNTVLVKRRKIEYDIFTKGWDYLVNLEYDIFTKGWDYLVNPQN